MSWSHTRVRRSLPWLLAVAASLLLGYAALSEREDRFAAGSDSALEDHSAQRLTIEQVVPRDPIAGSVLAIHFEASAPDVAPQALLGKTELSVLSRRPYAMVVQLPDAESPSHNKLRLVRDNERSKPFDLHIKPFTWRKPIRNFCGGIALLFLGIQALGGGARSLLGLASLERLAALARFRSALLAAGALLGALMQSTTAVAGLLSGLVSSRVLAQLPAAELFFCAQLGAAFVPVVLARTSEPGWGLPAIALGTLALLLAPDRRARSLGRLFVGAGLVALGVQVLRPDLDAIASSPQLLAAIAQLDAQGFLGRLGLMLVGAVLTALFQGPAPLLILALGLAELTGHASTSTTLALLSGSGLGAGLSALLTTTRDAHSWQLARLNLFTGVCSSLFALATLGLCNRVAHWLTATHARSVWNGKHPLPSSGWQISVAFFVSQLAATLLLFALLPRLRRWLSRRSEQQAPRAALVEPDQGRALSLSLLDQQAALPQIFLLALDGDRAAGQRAEHSLQQAGRHLQRLFSALSSQALGPAAVGCGQLQRSLARLLDQAEQLTDQRLHWVDASSAVPPLAAHERALLREMHNLVAGGLACLCRHTAAGGALDLEETCTREIHLNAAEARARRALLTESNASAELRRNLDVITLFDAYEAVGNQIFRLTEALTDNPDAPEIYDPQPQIHQAS